uniref:Glycine cleavage system H protein n=1 Tax=Thermorudis sp. TaxID=1969470 RepID=A0A7C3ALN2_9BACT
MYPENLRYTREHEWAKIEDGKVRVGITQFAAERLSDVVFVELPQPGTVLRQLQPFGVIESVKAVSDLYAPVSGTVVEVNTALADRPELVNQDPYGEGWMLVVEAADLTELDRLLTAEDYRQLVGDGRGG